MSTPLGAYIKGLREARGWDRPSVTARLSEREGRSVDPTWLWRIEEQGQWPRSKRFAALLDILGARQEDVTWLESNPGATTEEMRRRAEDAYRQLAARLSDEELDEAISLFERLRSDPKALGRWLEYGERLAGERRARGGE